MGSLGLVENSGEAKMATPQEPIHALFKEDKILQVRTGKVKPVFGFDTSAIFKTPLTKPVFVSTLGCSGDERSYPPHTGPDNALMHYASQHYPLWAAENPASAHHFKVGAFGENLVSSNATEDNVCVGDIMSIGTKGLLVQVTKPRQPCYKLNHRFEIKDMSLRSQTLGRTGWYYRVLRDGWMEAGDEMVLVERKFPRWTIKEVQRLLYVDRNDEDDMRELSEVPELGEEIRTILVTRLMKKKSRDDNERLQGGKEKALKWFRYGVIKKRKETPRICSFIFEAADPVANPVKVEPGSHIRVKLGDDGKLVRAYSVISGHSNRFKVGITLEPESRGGSKFMHDNVVVGDALSFSKIKSDFPLSDHADQHIMIAGGIGITAFLAAAQQLQEKGLDYQLYYAVRSPEDVAFSEDLKPLGVNLTILDGSKGQRLDIQRILGKANKGTHVYVCGPDRLMSAVTSITKDRNFPTENIHFEAFTAATSGDPFSAELVTSEKVVEVKEEQTLLDVLRDAGFDVPSSCEVGNCGSCKVGVRSGRVEHRGTGLMADEKKGSMLACVSRGIGRITLDL
jgi:ferredoxin-NADP reductase/MOSC domain-containing protein YiiM